jgi:class 3 adenylate cyclase
VASRIEGENKTFHTQALLSEATYRLVQDKLQAERMGEAKLKGVAEPVTLYSIARAG